MRCRATADEQEWEWRSQWNPGGLLAAECDVTVGGELLGGSEMVGDAMVAS
jgi:hypothetical protein